MLCHQWKISRWQLSRSSSAFLGEKKHQKTPKYSGQRFAVTLSSLPVIIVHFHLTKKHTHEGEVRLVDLGDFVVTGIEVSGVFGKRWYTIQLQVITID